MELEIALRDSRGYSQRARFFAPARISIGADRSCTFYISGGLPTAKHELVRLYPEEGFLLFDGSMRLQVRVGSAWVQTEALINDGLVRPVGDLFELALHRGSKVIVFLADDRRLLLRGEESSGIAAAPQRELADGAEPLCAHCGAHVAWAVVGYGAASPCGDCGGWTRFDDRRGPPPPPDLDEAGYGSNLPTFDALSILGSGPGTAAGADRAMDEAFEGNPWAKTQASLHILPRPLPNNQAAQRATAVAAPEPSTPPPPAGRPVRPPPPPPPSPDQPHPARLPTPSGPVLIIRDRRSGRAVAKRVESAIPSAPDQHKARDSGPPPALDKQAEGELNRQRSGRETLPSPEAASAGASKTRSTKPQPAEPATKPARSASARSLVPVEKRLLVLALLLSSTVLLFIVVLLLILWRGGIRV